MQVAQAPDMFATGFEHLSIMQHSQNIRSPYDNVVGAWNRTQALDGGAFSGPLRKSIQTLADDNDHPGARPFRLRAGCRPAILPKATSTSCCPSQSDHQMKRLLYRLLLGRLPEAFWASAISASSIRYGAHRC